MTDTDPRQKLVDLLDDLPIAMLTTLGSTGPRSVPMAHQEVGPDAELWFITARDTDHVRAIQQAPHVVLTYSSRDSWVAATGHAEVVDDEAKLADLWNTFAEAWLPGGPEDPQAVLLRVEIEQAEYWDTPGGTVASLLSLAKTKLTGQTYDADHGTLEQPGG